MTTATCHDCTTALAPDDYFTDFTPEGKAILLCTNCFCRENS